MSEQKAFGKYRLKKIPPSKEPLKQITFEEVSDFITGLEAISKERIKQRRNWEYAFQKWSDDNPTKGLDSYGCCGYGSMCDYCEDNSYGRPCVRALNEMLREKGIYLDYTKAKFEDVWNGILE